MTKTPAEFSHLPAAQRADAVAFMAAAKGYTSQEVARVLTNFQHGVNYIGCGKAHCARAWAAAQAGERAGLQATANRIRELTLPKLTELLLAERKRIELGRQAKADNEVRWARDVQERRAHLDARKLAADRWEALVKHDLLAKLGESFPRLKTQAELTALVDAAIAGQLNTPNKDA